MGPLSDWDVSKVTNMWGMFMKAETFNQPLNSWDVSKVTDMWGMFMKAETFNQPLNPWDVSKVTKMEQMFYGATAFNRVLCSSNWRYSTIKADQTQMFDKSSGMIK